MVKCDKIDRKEVIELKVIITAWKVFKLRKNGTLGSLFINAKDTIPIGKWLNAGYFPTKGFTPRQGWHCLRIKKAPHLKMKGRVWRKVEILDYEGIERPKSQGGLWYIAQHIKILKGGD